jgi:hypothetical protein
MSEMKTPVEGSWVPQACTLPTVEQPLRLAEFDELFAAGVRSVDRVEPARVRFELAPDAEVAARAAHLMVRETHCCSFFTFTLSATGGRVLWEVTVPAGHVEVLDALTNRVEAHRVRS